jgi:hypothetical protein
VHQGYVEQPESGKGGAGGASVRSHTTVREVSGIVRGDVIADSDGWSWSSDSMLKSMLFRSMDPFPSPSSRSCDMVDHMLDFSLYHSSPIDS